MNYKTLVHHKDFCPKPNNNNTRIRIIATVTKCLSPNHSTCSGKYVDYLTGLNIVKCECSCHSTTNEEDYCIDQALEECASTAQQDRTDEGDMIQPVR